MPSPILPLSGEGSGILFGSTLIRFQTTFASRSEPRFSSTKIVKAGRKRELVPGFPRRILSKTMSKIGKEERNRAGLHAQIAEPHPIFCKDTDKRGQSAPIRILPNESILGFVQDANEPNAKANKFVFCRNKISTTKLKIRKAASPYGNKRRRPAT